MEGKHHGQWVFRLANGDVHSGPMVEGELHGPWVVRFADGAVHEIRYVRGELDGKPVRRGGAGGCLTLVLVVVAMVFLVGC